MVLAAALVAGLAPAQAEELAESVLVGTVIKVRDGDSVVVDLAGGTAGARGDTIEVRLHGADAPESDQAGGAEARDFLRRRVLKRRVEIQPVIQDRYDRMVGVVYRDGANVSAALVEAGHAWAYRRYLADVPGADEFCRLEDQARKARRGLWSRSPDSWVPPWLHRAIRPFPVGELEARDYADETEADCRKAIPRSLPSKAQPDRRKKGKSPAVPDQARTCAIKGNISAGGERIYHLPGTSLYAKTRINERAGERWFCSEAEARAAGWRAAGTPRS